MASPMLLGIWVDEPEGTCDPGDPPTVEFLDPDHGSALRRFTPVRLFVRRGATGATPSTFAVVTLYLSGGDGFDSVDPVEFPAGTRFRTATGVEFAADEDFSAVLTDGPVPFAATAVLAGSSGNVAAATITMFVVDPFGGTVLVTNNAPATGGSGSSSTSSTTPLRRVFLHVTHGVDPREDFVFDGKEFGPTYSGPINQATSDNDGLAFVVLPDGGWRASPTINVVALDARGNETIAVISYPYEGRDRRS